MNFDLFNLHIMVDVTKHTCPALKMNSIISNFSVNNAMLPPTSYGSILYVLNIIIWIINITISVVILFIIIQVSCIYHKLHLPCQGEFLKAKLFSFICCQDRGDHENWVKVTHLWTGQRHASQTLSLVQPKTHNKKILL